MRSFINDKAVGVQYWTGSVSTFVETNPSFRMFEVDEETMIPLKVRTYIFNMSDPNELKWRWDHELTEFYGMKDLSPRSFDDLNDRIRDHEEVALKYHRTYRNGGPMSAIDKCDADCRKKMYCQQRNTV